MSILLFLIAAWDYSYNFTVDVTYDNNIFAYSAVDIADFLNQIHPYRYPFESLDDLTNSADLNLLLRNNFFGKKTTTFNLGLALNHYLTNRQKDYERIDFGVRQSFGKLALKVSYEMIPNYLIRYYYYPQGNDYIGCEAKYQTISGKLTYSADQNAEYSIQYGRKWDDYISEFNQYDANGHIIATGVNLRSKRFDFFLGYEFRLMQSDSTNIFTPGSEAVPDGSYDQHSLKSRLTYQLRIFSPSTLKFGYNYDLKNFTTNFSADSMHYGRQDYMHTLSLALELQVFTGMFMEFAYSQQWRIATSTLLPTIDTIKDYDKYRLGLGLSFYY